ncbi:MAG: simple sugar transport system substrate-binding protein [Solirubrobacteraceae bacterium]|jgi:simple sugar transport system substrate-binding protein|nr:simple sugar transport system substrate-binding protein [Solirubrobacteraceae bacterium]
MRRTLLICMLAALVGGCGGSAEVHERDLVVQDSAGASGRPPAPATAKDRGGGVRIAVVTHGQAASGFWSIVKNGIDAGAREMDVTVVYRAPDIYSVARMRQLIDEAVADRPDGLVVSIPTPALGGAIRRAVRAGIPVVSINSGSDVFHRLGVLAHVGQEELPAGEAAGKRLAAAGVRHALCLNHEVGNAGPDDRCRGFTRAMRAAGGTSRTVPIDVRDQPTGRRQMAAALADRSVDGLLTLSSDGAQIALAALRSRDPGGRIALGTFDLSPEVLHAVKRGRILFAIDQQAYLQGYLPIMLLTKLVRYGLFPSEDEVIPTGPHFVTRDTADQAIRLSERGIR